MSQGHVNDMLFDYLEDALGADARGTVEAHLRDCADCAHELEVTRRAEALFDQIAPMPLPEGFMARLDARLAEADSGAASGAAQPPHLTLVSTPPAASSAPASPAPSAGESRDLPKTIYSPPSASKAPVRRSYTGVLTLLAAMLCAVIGLGILLRPSGGENPASAPAALAYSDGDVQVERAGTTRHITRAMGLLPGDVVTTTDSAHAVLTVGTGGSVRLSPGTRLEVKAVAGKNGSGTAEVEVALVTGSAWVEETRNARCALRAAGVTVSPSDGVFAATVRNGQADVHVWQGQLKIASTDGAATVLAAGQKALIAYGVAPKAVAIDVKAVLQDAFVLWNLCLRQPQHPTRAEALLQPVLEASPTLPEWMRDAASPAPQPSGGAAPAAPSGEKQPGS